jgi:hypothetical protein
LESDKMSLMSTLAKVAIGVAVAKGAGAMMNKSGGVTQASSGGGLGGLVASSGGAGGLMDAFTGAMGGNAATAPAQNNFSFEFTFDANAEPTLHQLQIKKPLQP